MQCTPATIHVLSSLTIEEELLFVDLWKATPEVRMHSTESNFFRTVCLQWENFVGVCTDDTSAMMGKHVTYVAIAKEHANE